LGDKAGPLSIGGPLINVKTGQVTTRDKTCPDALDDDLARLLWRATQLL